MYSWILPPSMPQLHDVRGQRHTHYQNQQQQHRCMYQHGRQQRLPRADIPSPPPYWSHCVVASHGEVVTPLQHTPGASSLTTPPHPHPKRYHSRYRSPLPAPPPFGGPTFPSGRPSLQLTGTPAYQMRKQRVHHTDPRSSPTTRHAPLLSVVALEEHEAAGEATRWGTGPHHRRSEGDRDNHPVHDDSLPSTPVGQRIPARVQRSYDVYSGAAHMAGMRGRIEAAMRDALPSSSLTSQALQLKNVQSPPPTHHQTRKRLDHQWADAAPPSRQLGEPHTTNYSCGVEFRCSSPHYPRAHRDVRLGKEVDGAYLEVSETGAHSGPALSAAAAWRAAGCYAESSTAHTTPAVTIALTAPGTSCGLSTSMSSGDWRSPNLAAAGVWCHQQQHQQQQQQQQQQLLKHTRTTPASVAMRSSSVGLSDGPDVAFSSLSTPAHGLQTPQQQLQHRTLYHEHSVYPYPIHSLSLPSSASDVSCAVYGQCSTPREADRGEYHQALATPIVVVATTSSLTSRGPPPDTAATTARWCFTGSSVAPTAVGAPKIFHDARARPSSIASVSSATEPADGDILTRNGPADVSGGCSETTAAHDSIAHCTASLPASSPARLRYRLDTDFLYAVEEGDESSTTAAPTATGGATVMGDAFMHAAAQAATAMDSPVAVSRSVSFYSAEPSSFYCSPQQLRVGKVPQSARATASMTPAKTWTRRTGSHISVAHDLYDVHTTVTPPPQYLCRVSAAEGTGTNIYTTPPSARCGAGGAGEGWKSPLQWNPRQARENMEMEAVKLVAQFSVAQATATTAAAASRGGVGAPSTSSHLSSDTVSFNTLTLGAGSPFCTRNPSRPKKTVDLSVGNEPLTVGGEAEAEAEEWVELLLHYRDRENESGRMRCAPTNPTTTAPESTPEAQRVDDSSDSAGSQSWWATSSLMLAKPLPRVDGSIVAQHRSRRQRNRASTPSMTSSTSTMTSTRASSALPPAHLCTAMSAQTAAHTISRCVRYHVRRMHENEIRRVSSSFAGRIAAR